MPWETSTVSRLLIRENADQKEKNIEEKKKEENVRHIQ